MRTACVSVHDLAMQAIRSYVMVLARLWAIGEKEKSRDRTRMEFQSQGYRQRRVASTALTHDYTCVYCLYEYV